MKDNFLETLIMVIIAIPAGIGWGSIVDIEGFSDRSLYIGCFAISAHAFILGKLLYAYRR